jgi:hypothetical protein
VADGDSRPTWLGWLAPMPQSETHDTLDLAFCPCPNNTVGLSTEMPRGVPANSASGVGRITLIRVMPSATAARTDPPSPSVPVWGWRLTASYPVRANLHLLMLPQNSPVEQSARLPRQSVPWTPGLQQKPPSLRILQHELPEQSVPVQVLGRVRKHRAFSTSGSR